MKQRTSEKKRAIAGWVFIAPWLCGIVLYFIQPLISLVRYSVTDFQFMQEQGSMFAPLEGGWWENYRTAFRGDALFPQKFTATLLDMLYRVPVILIFSLFVAIVLNQKFKGRGFMRLIFFLPVLVTTGVISSIIKTSLTTVVVGGDSATNIFSAALLTRQLLDAGLPEGLVNTVGGMIANVSDLVWSSGVQILVFLMGLLTIPQSHYEVAQVEGATGWEAFWKVTFQNALHIGGPRLFGHRPFYRVRQCRDEIHHGQRLQQFPLFLCGGHVLDLLRCYSFVPGRSGVHYVAVYPLWGGGRRSPPGEEGPSWLRTSGRPTRTPIPRPCIIWGGRSGRRCVFSSS